MNKYKLEVSFKDKRGKIVDLISGEKINAITYLSFNKNAVRGNHYHKKTIQWTYVVSGKIRVVSQKLGKGITKLIIKKGDLIVDEKNESHAMKALENSEIVVFTKGPRGGKEYEKDTYRLQKLLINT